MLAFTSVDTHCQMWHKTIVTNDINNILPLLRSPNAGFLSIILSWRAALLCWVGPVLLSSACYLTHSWWLDWWVPGHVHTPVGLHTSAFRYGPRIREHVHECILASPNAFATCSLHRNGVSNTRIVNNILFSHFRSPWKPSEMWYCKITSLCGTPNSW
jgi:hypothetical protein